MNIEEFKKEYCGIITNAKSRTYFRGSERHHILPKSLGGKNTKDNLVYLTPAEHYRAHYLLWRITNTPQMAYAFWRMNMGKNLLSPEECEELRNQCSEENSKRNSKPVYCLELDKEFKSCREAAIYLNENIDKSGYIGVVCNGKLKTAFKMHWCWLKDKEEFLKRKDEMLYETKHWLELRGEHISESKKGKPVPNAIGKHFLSDEAKKKISDKNKGKESYWKGKHLSEETKEKLSEAAKRRGIKIKCVETGIIYSSLKNAILTVDGYSFEIKNAAIDGTEYKGFHWELV